MTGTIIHHAIGLHLHQPPGNLRLLIDVNPGEAEEIVCCYERAVRYALRYRDVARLHIGFSGVLLEQLIDPDIVDRYRHLVDLPAMLDQYREAENIELIGMGYYHPIFPLIPRADWLEQLERGRAIMERVFGRVPQGFWPPEMAFTMDMIPALVQAGYDYVVVDGVHVRPEDGISDIFRPYVACQDGCCISVVPRDREVSNAQSNGIDLQWFQDEVRWRVTSSPRPRENRLVTTWSDGENGGWFRQRYEESGFFGHFFAPYMERCRTDDYPIKPVCLSHYLARIRPLPQARIQTGAWNVRSTSGEDLSQWSGSERQRQAVAEVKRLSGRYWDLCRSQPDAFRLASEAMFRARRLILEAETSCFLFWSDAWIPHLYARTASAEMALREVEARLEAGSAVASGGFDEASTPASVATLEDAAREAKSDSAEPRSGSDP
ncbi:glycoside hydrolase family 57 [uncultured Thiocystis sp.]|jgi:alpha-amylase/alpha-mannosidase (GH57 family)|uniref:glycoside hydrolase family 57 n=1 Tax=uncultured Thiocystis sp. TaxID=1202134 RepID=UPI0025EAF40D|nr:glycoside hydrolase family 57 [uncultured Thiocystis sp.]